jgi:hypothetical protein
MNLWYKLARVSKMLGSVLGTSQREGWSEPVKRRSLASSAHAKVCESAGLTDPGSAHKFWHLTPVDRRPTPDSFLLEARSRVSTNEEACPREIDNNIKLQYRDSVVSQLPTTVCTRGMSSLTTGSRYDTMLSTTLLVLAPGKPKTEAVRGHLKASSLQRPASSATTVTSPVTTAATRLACIHVGLAAAMPLSLSTAR